MQDTKNTPGLTEIPTTPPAVLALWECKTNGHSWKREILTEPRGGTTVSLQNVGRVKLERGFISVGKTICSVSGPLPVTRSSSSRRRRGRWRRRRVFWTFHGWKRAAVVFVEGNVCLLFVHEYLPAPALHAAKCPVPSVRCKYTYGQITFQEHKGENDSRNLGIIRK